jgi:hypothetical protein
MDELVYMLSTNQHLDLCKQLQVLVSQPYRIKARFDYVGANGHWLWCGKTVLAMRKNKRDAITWHESVNVIEENMSKTNNSSHKYPVVCSKGAYCILEFTMNGLPVMSKLNGWQITILEITPVPL